MDELTIGGKLYISARRAAKEHKYHSDYLGQLVRAGKLEGTKVGRSWYISKASLSNFLSQVQTGYVKENNNNVRVDERPTSVFAKHSMLTYAKGGKDVDAINSEVEDFMTKRRCDESERSVLKEPELAEPATQVEVVHVARCGSGQSRLRKILYVALFVCAPVVIFFITLSFALNIPIGLPR